jgi:hypothetical protein
MCMFKCNICVHVEMQRMRAHACRMSYSYKITHTVGDIHKHTRAHAHRPVGGRISLDRDDRVHGSPNALGISVNGPETTTFRNLLPGRYDVYINVYKESERFHGDVTIEAYLGNGISSCLVDIVQCTLTSGRWFHAGYFVAYTSEQQLQRLTNSTGISLARPTYGAEEEQVFDPKCMDATRRQLKPDDVGRPRHPNPLASLSLPSLPPPPCPLAHSCTQPAFELCMWLDTEKAVGVCSILTLTGCSNGGRGTI